MDLWTWFALIVAVVLGMCVGAAINREYGRAFQRQAARSQALVRELRTELAAAEQRAFMTASAERLNPAPPMVVNLNLASLPPQPWPLAQPPVIDAQVVPALEQDR